MNSIKVSVIVPVYNNAQYLNECLDNLIYQTLKDIEIICVDDGSTDNSVEILEEYQKKDSRIIVIKQENKSAGSARNEGMAVAKGKYFYFMDSDDYVETNFLEKAVKLSEERNTDIMVFDFYRFNENEEVYCNGLNRNYYPNKAVFSYKDIPHVISKLISPVPWNKLYNGDFVRNSGLKWLELKSSNDITFTGLSVLKANRISYEKEAFLHYRVNLANSTTSIKRKNPDNIFTALLSLVDQAMELPHASEIMNSVREYVGGALIWSMRNYNSNESCAGRILFEKRLNRLFNTHPLFSLCNREDFYEFSVYNYINQVHLTEFTKVKPDESPKIIASMTSFPARILDVYKSISSIYRQTLVPDKVILWLAESQFPNKEDDLPPYLLEYKKLGLEIEWTPEDIRPHKKYYYAIKKYPNDLIITLDDDLTYHEEMVELLYYSYQLYPNAISTVRTHLINFTENGEIASYSDWTKEYSDIVGQPSMRLFSTSGAGTLYPPNLMDEEVFNIDAIKDLCLNADDLWLKVMQIRKNVPVVLVRPNRLLKYIEGTQEVALLKTNVGQNQNDVQLRKVLDYYGMKDEDLYSVLNTEYKNYDYKAYLLEQLQSKAEEESLLMKKEMIAENAKLKDKLEKMKKSKTYRLSRYITYVPRKIKRTIKKIK